MKYLGYMKLSLLQERQKFQEFAALPQKPISGLYRPEKSWRV